MPVLGPCLNDFLSLTTMLEQALSVGFSPGILFDNPMGLGKLVTIIHRDLAA